jgi:hypothetical protein
MRLTRSPRSRLAARLDVLVDRFALCLSRGRRIDGMWVGCFFVEKFSPTFGRVEEALRLIKVYDPLRYDRLIRDVDRIWVTLVPGGGLGEFRNALRLCALDERFVLADTTRPEQIASTIVHEAAHARLMRCGIGYEAELRARVEAVCFRRERAFAAKLPDGDQVWAQAERSLTGFPPDYWTNEAFRDREDQGIADTLRFLGVPDFFIRVLFGFRKLLRGVKRFAQRVKRLFRA